jgi:hypothetical protein
MTVPNSRRNPTCVPTTAVRRMMLLPSAVALLLLLLLLSLSPFGVNANALGKPRRETPTARTIKVQNKSGRRVDILWINRFTANGVVTYHSNSDDGKGYPYGGETSINSYVTHEFQVQEMPSTTKKNKCLGPNDTCRMGYFQVNKEEHQGRYRMLYESTFCIGREGGGGFLGGPLLYFF